MAIPMLPGETPEQYQARLAQQTLPGPQIPPAPAQPFPTLGGGPPAPAPRFPMIRGEAPPAPPPTAPPSSTPPTPPGYPVTQQAIQALQESPQVVPPPSMARKAGAIGLAAAGSLMPKFAGAAALGQQALLSNDTKANEVAQQQARQKNLLQAAQLEQGQGRVERTGAGAGVVNLPGYHSGADLAKLGYTVPEGQAPLDPNSFYTVRVQGDKIVMAVGVTPPTRAGGLIQDPNNPGMFLRQAVNAYSGQPTGPALSQLGPMGAYPTTSETMRFDTDRMGNRVAFPVMSTSRRQLPGALTNPFGAQMPTQPAPTPPTGTATPPAPTPPPPPAGASVGTAQTVPGVADKLTDATRNNWEALGRAIGAYEAFDTMAKDFVKGEGLGARAAGARQWVESKLGYNDEVSTFNNMREGLRSLFSKFAIGNDVGNLSAQEQEWILNTLPKLGMTEGELALTSSFVMDMLLKPRMKILDSLMKGELDPQTARQETLNQQAQFMQKRAEIQNRLKSVPTAPGRQAPPKPPTPGARADRATMLKYLEAAGNDPIKASQMAVADGWTFQ